MGKIERVGDVQVHEWERADFIDPAIRSMATELRLARDVANSLRRHKGYDWFCSDCMAALKALDAAFAEPAPPTPEERRDALLARGVPAKWGTEICAQIVAAVAADREARA